MQLLAPVGTIPTKRMDKVDKLLPGVKVAGERATIHPLAAREGHAGRRVVCWGGNLDGHDMAPGQTPQGQNTEGRKREQIMNKGELVTAISDRSGVSKADVERVLKGFEDIAQQIVAGGSDKLTLPGFLAIEQTSRAAREGINPQTKMKQMYPAKKSAKITAGSTLKAVANGDKPAPS